VLQAAVHSGRHAPRLPEAASANTRSQPWACSSSSCGSRDWSGVLTRP
jgi:hypothetical protein